LTASGEGLKFCVLKVGSVFVAPSSRKKFAFGRLPPITTAERCPDASKEDSWIRLRAKTDVGAGRGEHQVNQHAPVQGQFANGGGLDHLSDAGVGRLQDFAARSDLDALRDGTTLIVISTASFWPTSSRKDCFAVVNPDASTFSS